MRTQLLALLGAVSLVLVSGTPTVASEPITLAPISHANATLDLLDRAGQVTEYTPAMLEGFPTYRIRTKTPWRAEEATFEGVLLSDLLAAHGMEDLSAIRVVAENDYTTIIEREVWEDTPFLIATRVNGQAHTRRARGPIQFVVASENGVLPAPIDERHLVWMARRIEVGD